MNNIVTAELMLDEETTIRVQAIGAAYGDVSGGIPKGVMEQITQGIVQLSKPIGAALQETGAKRASVEYGIQLAVEGGQCDCYVFKYWWAGKSERDPRI